MYKYAATDLMFDGVSNIYLVSIATAILAVIVAFYCSNFIKDENENQLEEVLNDNEEEEDSFLYDSSGNELENHKLTRKLQKPIKSKVFKNESDSEDNDLKMDYNSSSTYENSDADETHFSDLVSKLKLKRVKDLESQLTMEQLEEEKRIEREQLAAIFELLKKQEAELNMKEIDEMELNAQLALYR